MYMAVQVRGGGGGDRNGDSDGILFWIACFC